MVPGPPGVTVGPIKASEAAARAGWRHGGLPSVAGEAWHEACWTVGETSESVDATWACSSVP